MEDEPLFQQAIYASIQASRQLGTSRSTQSRVNTGRTFHPSLGRSQSQPTTDRRGPRKHAGFPSDRRGRVESLRRSGISPAVSQPRTLSPDSKGPLKRSATVPQSKNALNQASRSGVIPKTSSSSIEIETAKNICPEAEKWKRVSGPGSFHIKSVNGFDEGYIENTQADICLISQCSPCEQTNRVQFDFRCAHAAPASGNLPAFRLVVAFQKHENDEGVDHTSVLVNCRDRFVSIETMLKGLKTEVCRAQDRELRPGVYHSFRLDLLDKCIISVFCGGKVLIDSFAVGPEVCVVGPMGLAVTKSRLDFCKFQSCSTVFLPEQKNIPPYTGDDRHLIEAIERDVIDRDLGVAFEDIASLEDAKRLLDEAVTLPLIIPEFFTGIREPWKGVLLFGPPGTGKTLLAKALANKHDIRFFNCSSSTLMSKWRGESEKLVRVLFNMARHYAPSIVFFDEADALVSTRGGDGEHEASRRFKSELLQQMDGVTTVIQPGRNVIVLATTNCPWDLDEAMRRRLEKRIYIPLPGFDARLQMLRINLQGVSCEPDIRLEKLAHQLEGFSGADIRLVCRDASLMPMRRLISNKTPDEIKDLRDKGHLEVQLSMDDFEAALTNTQPSVSQKDVQKFAEWGREFAST